MESLIPIMENIVSIHMSIGINNIFIENSPSARNSSPHACFMRHVPRLRKLKGITQDPLLFVLSLLASYFWLQAIHEERILSVSEKARGERDTHPRREEKTIRRNGRRNRFKVTLRVSLRTDGTPGRRPSAGLPSWKCSKTDRRQSWDPFLNE